MWWWLKSFGFWPCKVLLFLWIGMRNVGILPEWAHDFELVQRWEEKRGVHSPLFDLRAVMFGSFRLEPDNHCLSSRNEKTFDQLTRQKFHWWPPNTSLMLRMSMCLLSGSSCLREQTASGGHNRLFVFSNWRYFLRVCYQNSRYKGLFIG